MKKILIAVVILLISIINLNAQDSLPKFYVGGYAGLGLNYHSATFGKLEGFPSCCDNYNGGFGLGFSIGGLFEYTLTQRFTFETRIGYSDLSGQLQRTEVIGNHLVEPTGNTTPTTVESEYTLDSKLGLFTFEPVMNFRGIRNLILSGGLRFGFPMSSDFDQEERITSPNNVIFIENGQRTRNVFTGEEIPEATGFHVFAALGAGYEIPLNRNLRIAPEARFYIPFTSVSPEDWSVSQLNLGISVRYAYLPKEKRELIKEIDYFRDTTSIFVMGLPREEVKLISSKKEVTMHPQDGFDIERTVIVENYERKVPQKAEIRASLSTVGITSAGIESENPTIIIEEIITTEQFPLLPYVFFDANSSDLRSTSQVLLSAENTLVFAENNLRWDALAIYGNMLNVVGKRLNDNPSANLIITGTNSGVGTETDNLTLSKARADAIKDYLVTNWNIASSRISVERRNLPDKPANINHPEGIAENQRAELTSNNPNIMKAVELNEIARVANPPQVRITPRVESDVPVDNWSLDIYHSDTRLRDYRGKGKPESVIWDIEEEPIPNFDRPAEIRFKATDELNQVAEAQQSLKIDQLTISRKKVEQRENYQIERFSLVLFDFDRAELTPVHRRSLDEIKARIKPNSRVIIQGYTDITGSAEYNRELAGRRNAEVTRYLGIPQSQVRSENIGSSVLLYDNSTPQGRSYCRTVRITVETPID